VATSTSRWQRHALGHGLHVLDLPLSSGRLAEPVFTCATLEEFTLSAMIAVREVIAPKSVCHVFVRFGDPSADGPAVEKLNAACPALEPAAIASLVSSTAGAAMTALAP